MEPEVKKYDFDRVVRLVISIVAISLSVMVVSYLSPVLWPFLVGFLLAYILDPVVRWIQRHTPFTNRALAVVITLILVIAAITLVCMYLIPYITDEVSGMGKMLAAYAKSSFKIPYLPPAIQQFINHNIDFQDISNMLSKDQWTKLIQDVASGTWSVVGSTVSMLWSFVSGLIVLLYMFFVLLDYDKISRGFKVAIPKRYRHMALRVLDDVEHTMSRYFRGQALVSLFVGIIFAIEFYIIGLPMAVVFGLFIGVLNMVPYLQLLSIPIAAFLCLVASVATGAGFWGLFGWTIVAYCICQLIQDLVLIPLIMRQQMGLNGAIVFLALSLWAYILGFVGLIIALPLTTLIISYYCEFVLHQPNPLRVRTKNKKAAKSRKHVRTA